MYNFERRPRLFYNWKDLSLEGVVWGTFEGPQSDLDSDRVDEMTAASATINQQSPIQEIIYTQTDKYLSLQKTNICVNSNDHLKIPLSFSKYQKKVLLFCNSMLTTHINFNHAKLKMKQNAIMQKKK